MEGNDICYGYISSLPGISSVLSLLFFMSTCVYLILRMPNHGLATAYHESGGVLRDQRYSSVAGSPDPGFRGHAPWLLLPGGPKVVA